MRRARPHRRGRQHRDGTCRRRSPHQRSPHRRERPPLVPRLARRARPRTSSARGRGASRLPRRGSFGNARAGGGGAQGPWRGRMPRIALGAARFPSAPRDPLYFPPDREDARSREHATDLARLGDPARNPRTPRVSADGSPPVPGHLAAPVTPPPPPPPSRPDRIRGSARAIAPPRPRAFPCAARSPPPDRDPRAPR